MFQGLKELFLIRRNENEKNKENKNRRKNIPKVCVRQL